MTYSALYRKFRPKRFSEIVGQEHIVRTLGNQIKSGRISHAYMFCGTRGTGKTSTAKLFARAINCESPVDGDICGKCSFCTLSEADIATAIIEMDAASNNRVENIRDISEEIGYLAPYGKYKVYIVDEVHMLSNSAFNALLKTLEEPPAHAVFILASTEPQKIPATIHSRCQRFDFKRLSTAEITGALQGIMALEGVNAAVDALRYIAGVADGSMRDAQSILDQCMSFYYNEEITLQKVVDLLGASDSSVLFRLADALNNKNAADCLEIIDAAVGSGRDIVYLAEQITLHFRDLIILKTVGAEVADISPDKAAGLQKQSEAIDFASLMGFVRSFSELHQKMKYASNRRVLLELGCIGLCVPESFREPDAAVQSSARVNKPVAAKKPPEEIYVKPQKQEAQVKKAVSEDYKNLAREWSGFVAGIEDNALRSMLSKTVPGHIEDDSFYIVCPNHVILDFLRKKHDVVFSRFPKGGEGFTVSFALKADYDKKYRVKFGADDDLELTGYNAVRDAFGLSEQKD